MKLDLRLMPTQDLRQDAALIALADQLGFDAVWTIEREHNPFFALTLAGNSGKRIGLGTFGAAAFPRSPMVTAQIAWDLARQTDGRFSLGLGMPTAQESERYYGEDWRDPVDRMREYIQSLRAIWDTFQNDARLRFRGEYYRFRLMVPFFNPGSIQHPGIPIHLAGDHAELYALAAEACDGLQLPAYFSASYLRESALPGLTRALSRNARARAELEVSAVVKLVSGFSVAETEEAALNARRWIVSNAGRRLFETVMDHHGWGAQAAEMSALARAGQIDAAAVLISDDILSAFAIIAEPKAVLRCIEEQYAGGVERVSLELSAKNVAVLTAIARSR